MGLYRESNRSIESQKDSTSTTNVDKMTVNSPRKTDVGYVVGGNRPGRGVHLKLIQSYVPIKCSVIASKFVQPMQLENDLSNIEFC